MRLGTSELDYYINRIILLTQKAEHIKSKEDSQYNKQQYNKYLAQVYSAKNHITKMFQTYSINNIEYRDNANNK